MRTWSPHCKYF